MIEGGETGPVITFTDAGNVTHAMTPQEARAMGFAIFQRNAALYQAARVHKNAILAITGGAGLDAYDLNAGWPV